MVMAALKPVNLFWISRLKPSMMQIVSNITAIPKATATIPIFTIGFEIVLLLRIPFVMRLAIKRSTDTVMIQNLKNTNFIGLTLILVLLSFIVPAQTPIVKPYSSVTCGIARFDKYLPLLKNKKVAVVTNVSGQLNGESVVDEHGFRGDTEAGEKVNSQIDQKTGLPVVSLYGKHKKPTRDDLKNIDIVIYDIQDIGVRFYTYISTMTYVMEACAENKKQMIVFDRPNPNGFYVDGPVMQKEWSGFLGLHPVPVGYDLWRICQDGKWRKMAGKRYPMFIDCYSP
jgi:hypothetical protein